MKRLVALLLALCALSLVLAACGEEPAAPADPAKTETEDNTPRSVDVPDTKYASIVYYGTGTNRYKRASIQKNEAALLSFARELEESTFAPLPKENPPVFYESDHYEINFWEYSDGKPTGAQYSVWIDCHDLVRIMSEDKTYSLASGNFTYSLVESYFNAFMESEGE